MSVIAYNGAWCPVRILGVIDERLALGNYVQTSLGFEKGCSCCREFWPSDTEFYYPSGGSPDGLAALCKACYAETQGRTADARKRDRSPVFSRSQTTDRVLASWTNSEKAA